MKNKFKYIPIIFTILGIIVAITLGSSNSKPISRNITIRARQYSYDPPEFSVNRFDTLHIKLVSMDVMHGFYLEGYDLDAQINANTKAFQIRHPSEGFNWKDTEEIVIIAHKMGKFRYRCSHTCGTMHPFMQGEMIVNPNMPLHAGMGAVIGFTAGMLLMIYRKIKSGAKHV